MQIYEHFSEEELAILRARAKRIATPVQTEAQEEMAMALFVTIQGEHYALPMDAISAVYDSVHITPVPNVPDFALGIANIRGHVVFVLHLGTLLDIPSAEAPQGDLPVIVLESDLGIAFQVETVEGIESFATSRLTKDIPALNLAKKSYLLGLSPEGTALLNVKAIVDTLIAGANS